jgi:transcriptional regulator with XRE-family HTH domain
MYMQTTGQAIKSARERADLTQRALADRVQVSPSYVSNLEADRRVPSGRLRHRLLRVLDVSPLDLEASRIQRALNNRQRQDNG